MHHACAAGNGAHAGAGGSHRACTASLHTRHACGVTSDGTNSIRRRVRQHPTLSTTFGLFRLLLVGLVGEVEVRVAAAAVRVRVEGVVVDLLDDGGERLVDVVTALRRCLHVEQLVRVGEGL